MQGISATQPVIINAAEIQADLHRVCTAQHLVERLADLCNAPYSTLYSQIAGQTKGLPLETLRAAHLLSDGHRALERWLIDPGRRSVPDRPLARDPSDPIREGGQVCAATGRLMAALMDAAEDGRLSPAEEADLRACIEHAHRELQDVSALLDRAREMGGKLGTIASRTAEV